MVIGPTFRDAIISNLYFSQIESALEVSRISLFLETSPPSIQQPIHQSSVFLGHTHTDQIFFHFTSPRLIYYSITDYDPIFGRPRSGWTFFLLFPSIDNTVSRFPSDCFRKPPPPDYLGKSGE